MKAREHSNCIRDVNTKYTVAWDPLQLWRMEAKTVTSSRMRRNLFRKVLKDVLHTKEHVEDTVFQLMGGLRSGMGYCGAETIEEA